MHSENASSSLVYSSVVEQQHLPMSAALTVPTRLDARHGPGGDQGCVVFVDGSLLADGLTKAQSRGSSQSHVP